MQSGKPLLNEIPLVNSGLLLSLVKDHTITQATFNPKFPTTREEDNIMHIVYVKKMRLRDVKKHTLALTNKCEHDFEPKSFWVQVPQFSILRIIRDTDEHLLVWMPKSVRGLL